MSKFDDFLEQLTDSIAELVRDELKEFEAAALKDGKAFVEKSMHDLLRWTGLLDSGHLTKDDFAWLVAGKKDLAEMAALEQAGLTLVRLDKFRTALIDLVVGTAFNVFL